MSFSFAQFVLNTTYEYNHHKACEVNGLSIEQGLEICKELEELSNKTHSFVLELYTDGGFSLYRKDFWKKGEHPLGHLDQLILSVTP
jgi:hypothetical protein